MAVSSKKVTADKVAKSFVKKYYSILSTTPSQDLYKFYKEESSFCHGEGCAPETPVSGLESIKAKISELDLGEAVVNVDAGSMDAQQSFDGGVLVLVTGSMTKKGMSTPRRFAQSFFLARQNVDQPSYYVLNDIFRFLDPSPQATPVGAGSAEGVVKSAVAHKEAEVVVSSPVAPTVARTHEPRPAAQRSSGGKGDKEREREREGGVEAVVSSGPPKPKTWAAMVAKHSTGTDAAPPASAPKGGPSRSPVKGSHGAGPKDAPAAPSSAVSPATESTKPANASVNGRRQGGPRERSEEEISPTRSLYIKATDGQDLFESDVRGLLEGHVSVRHVNVKGHFAFVELQDTPSMTKVLALAAEDPSLFYLGEREVTVEERRSHAHRSNHLRERGPRREGSDPSSGRPPQSGGERGRDRNRPPHGAGNGEAKPFRKERPQSGSTGRGEGRQGDRAEGERPGGRMQWQPRA